MILWNEYSRYDYENDVLRKKQEKGYVRYYAWHPTMNQSCHDLVINRRYESISPRIVIVL